VVGFTGRIGVKRPRSSTRRARRPGRPGGGHHWRITILSSLKASVSDVVGARDLLRHLVRRDIRVRYKQTAMGLAWALFMPILVVFSGMIVRVVAAQHGGGVLDRSVIGGLAVKAVPWGFVVGGLGFTTASLVTNQSLVTKVYFPREVLPLAALLAQGFDSGIALIAVLCALPLLGLTLTPALLWVPVLLGLIFLQVLAAGLILSCGNVFYRDVRYIVQVVLTFGIFFTPVFYEPSMLGGTGSLLVMLNPVAPLLEGLRLAVIDGHDLLSAVTVSSGEELLYLWRPWYLAYSALWAVVGLMVAAPVFRAGVTSFAEYI
jgi:homopolymeric O-antigen transport system permease protein